MRTCSGRALVPLLALMCWLGCSAPLSDDSSEARSFCARIGDSAIEADGWRFTLESLAMKGNVLKGFFRIESLDRARPSLAPALHPWGGLWVVFYDDAGAPILPEIFEDFFYDPDFLLGKTAGQSIPFQEEVPPRARYVAVQYGRNGTSHWRTKRVVIAGNN